MSHTTTYQVRDLQRAVFVLRQAAMRFAPADRVQQLAAQWIASSSVPDRAWREATATRLAGEVVLSTPSILGVTAFDRLARVHHTATSLDAFAMALLRRGQFRLGRLEVNRHRVLWRDLADGTSGELVSTGGLPRSDGLHVLVRLASLEDGRLLPVGLFAPLDAACLAMVHGFIRPDGRGLASPLLCAKLVFRHVVRFGGVALADATGDDPDELPFRPESNPLDAMAATWAEQRREPDERERGAVRQRTTVETVLQMLASIRIAREVERSALAAAYRRITLIMLETMALRASNGSTLTGLDQVAAALNEAIAHRLHPPELRALFDELRASVATARRGASDGDLDKLLQRIQALRAKTVEQGCTEAEAMSAAEKVSELLDRYGLSLSELDLRQQSCEGVGVETDRRRRAPIDDCMGTIAKFFDCRIWAETSPHGTLRYVFFGLRADVQAALYLHDLVSLAFATETERFRRGAVYQETHSRQRASATNSFQLGLSRGINGKLRTIRSAREATLRGGTGRDLVPIKASVVDAELAKLGLSLRQKGGTARRSVLADAFHAGQAAGARFEYAPGIETG